VSVANLLRAHGFIPAVPIGGQSLGTLEPLQHAVPPLSPASPAEDLIDAGSMSPVTQVRTKLLLLAAADDLPADLVHGLVDDDLSTCSGETDVTLTAYLRAIAASRAMDARQVPPGWGGAAEAICEGCGPVLLWPGSPSMVKACPWCFKRKAGREIPRPGKDALGPVS